MKKLMWAVTAVVLAFASASTFATLTPGQKMAAEALVKQFTAPEFAARQQAVDRLVEMGVDVAPVVKDALAKTLDNEVKLRCEMVLKALRKKFGAEAVDGKTATDAIKYDASRVTLNVRDAPLSEVLSELAEKSGNAPVDAGMFKDRTVTVSVKDVPYWQAMDLVCKPAGAFCDRRWHQNKGFVLLAESAKDAPEACAYAGPAVVSVNQVERTKTVRQLLRFRTSQYPYPQPDWTERYIRVGMDYAVEERLRVLGGRVGFRKATTRDGTDLLKDQAAALDRADAMEKTAGHEAADFTMDPSPYLVLKDRPEGVKGPLRIEGVVRLTFAVGRKELRIDKVFAGEKRTAEAGNVRLDLTSGVREGVSGAINLKIAADPPKGRNINYDSRLGFGFTVVDANGKKQGKFTGWSQEGDGKDVTITITVTDLPATTGDLALVYSYPESVETKEYPFTLKDVPLP